MTKLNFKALMMLGVIMATPAKADFNSDLSSVQKQWAVVNYELVDVAQLDAFEKLASETAEFTKANDQQAASHIWYGIVLSSYAGAKGGLGALGLAKDAKAQFEKALSLDPKALEGSAYTSLATLYGKVPGWPIGFGDDDEAKKLFKQALELNPRGIDSNYLYASFLYDERKYKSAKEFLLVAQQAPARPDRPKADLYRQQEITELLAKVEKKIKR
ncbi:tetratricopeptide repeat protein [Pseudoalteromonas sp. PB2-1]|uniref:tetratricopeptide repeat protein n=1 Tax=Pseudoalteromonas sp. PB2-1 TaxID=2907242 RepID=UPI00370488BA